MPCRPSPEEEAWSTQVTVEEITRLQQQRKVTLSVLRRLLDRAGIDVQVVVRLMHLTETAEPQLPSDDQNEWKKILNLRQRAEVKLCIARFTLMQIASLVPWKVKASLADAIAQERRDHLRHRLDDCAAEAATLAKRITDLSGPNGCTAEVMELRQELERLRALTIDALMANRDFGAGIACPLCKLPLPELPGMTRMQLNDIAEAISRRERIKAIGLVRQWTGLGLAEGNRYVACPHGHAEHLPAVSGLSPFRCQNCGKSLPQLPNLTVSQVDHLQVALAKDRWDEVFSLLQQATGWDLDQAKRFVQCPHPLP